MGSRYAANGGNLSPKGYGNPVGSGLAAACNDYLRIGRVGLLLVRRPKWVLRVKHLLRYSLYHWKQWNNTINNEGSLSFEYDLEDYDPASYDTGDQSSVFNCGDSALWVNFYKVFKNDVDTMYSNLRSGTKFNYDYINNKMRAHQEQWPVAIWNEDAYNKYIGSYIDKGEDYLEMLQGDKKSQRDWWLFNGFKYRDSKYFTADATSKFITLRL